MGRYVGDQNQHALIFESGTYANPNGTGQWIGMVTGFEPNESTNVEMVRYTGTNDRNVGQFVQTAKDYAPSITFHPQNWRLLGYALGSIIDGGSPSPYSHTMVETNNNAGNAFTSGTQCPFMSFTIEDAKQSCGGTGLNHIKTFKGNVVESFSLSSSEGGIMECEVSTIAKEMVYSSGTVTAITEDTQRPYIFGDSKWALPSGTPLNNVREWSYTLTNNLNAPHYNNGSVEIDVPIPENRDHEVTMTVDASEDWGKAMYNQYFQGGSTFNMLLDISKGTSYLKVTYSGCELTEMSDPSNPESVNQWELTINPKSVSAVAEDTIEKYNPW